MTGDRVECSDRMDLQQTEMFGASYAGRNNQIVALSKKESSFLSKIKGGVERMNNLLLIEQIIPSDIYYA